MKGFLMNVAIAEKFFQRCLEKEAITEQERLKVMNEIVHEENVRILKEEQIKKLLIEKKVMRIKANGK